MKSKTGKEESKKCDNKKAVRATEYRFRQDRRVVGAATLNYPSQVQVRTKRVSRQFFISANPFPEKCRSNPSGSLNHIPVSLFSQERFYQRCCSSPSIVPTAPGVWGQDLSAAGSSQTHCLDWCWASLTAGEEFLSSPWLIPAHQFPHLLFTNRSTPCQLRRQDRPVP